MPNWSVEEYEMFERRRQRENGPAMAGLGAAERKPDPQPALDKNESAQDTSTSRVRIIVTLIACRKRLLDDDNSIAGFKCLRDAVSGWLRLDDADPRIRFEYGQVRSDRPGTIVRIERL